MILAVVLAFMPLVLGNDLPMLRLDTYPPSTYVEYNVDAWLSESYVTDLTSFDLRINYAPDQGNPHLIPICHLYLLVSVDRNPIGNVTVKINGTELTAWDGDFDNGWALVPPVTENGNPFKFQPHGIFNYPSVYFEVVDITDLIPAGLPVHGTVNVPVEIDPTNPTKVHFDAVGANCDDQAIAWNPFSEDVTYHNIPEFATIAIPVALIFGLFFFFNHRKRGNQSPAG